MVNNFKTRVSKLESKKGVKNVILRFSDGSTRSVRILDPLGVLLAAVERISWQDSPEENEDWRNGEVRIPGRYDDMIDLLGCAEGIECDDVFLKVVHGATTQAIEVERNQLTNGNCTATNGGGKVRRPTIGLLG
jgi:hypothetical protein